MSPFRYRDDDSSTGTAVAGVVLGAIAGFAVGMFVAQRVGGFRGIATRFRNRGRPGAADETPMSAGDDGSGDVDFIEDEDWTDADSTAEGEAPLLEERVLEAFNNDPILAERAIDIGAVGDGIIELAGWVDDEREAEHAMTVAHGVPGVDTVVNRLMVEDEERERNETVQRAREGDPALNDARWEGQQVGTGRRRQGNSTEPDRHADPKPELEDRWLAEDQALKNPAEDLADIRAERRRKSRPSPGEASRGD